jgi:NitT/TauT family transport system ATP-binding protein/nitrate/nitrite transport system substrate-binding protein
LRDIPNRFEAARRLARPDALNQPLDVIAPSLIGSCLTQANSKARHIPHYNRFSSLFAPDAAGAYAVNTPNQAQAKWLLEKMQRYEQSSNIDKASLEDVSKRAFREDIFFHALDMRKERRVQS